MKNRVISILLAFMMCVTVPVVPVHAQELPDVYSEEDELVLGGMAEPEFPENEVTVVGLADPVMAETEASSDASVNGMITRALAWKRGGKDIVMDDEFLSGVSSTATDWDALALGRLGVQDNYGGFVSAAGAYVSQKYAADPQYGLSTNTATEWHRLTVALLASGGDPLNVGGQNLIRDGVYECKIGAPWRQGTNGAVWALIALDSFGYEVPEGASYDREDLIQYLLEHEKNGGGWALSDPLNADADITAMAIQALAPYAAGNAQVKAAAERGLAFLKKCQTGDGDISGSMAGKESCEATCQTILAFCSMGRDPKDVVSKNGKSLIDGLRKYENQADGGFYHDVALADKGSDGMATQQALYTLAGYQRYLQGKTNLYDFRADAKTAQYRIKADGRLYLLDAGNANLALPTGTKEIFIENLPIGNYDGAVVEADGRNYEVSYRRADGSTPVKTAIPVAEETAVTVHIAKLSGEEKTWTLKITADGQIDDASAAHYVEVQIAALKDTQNLTLADEAEVKEARAAYDSLTEAQKKLVKNADKLTEAEKKLKELKEAEKTKLEEERKAFQKKVEAIQKPLKISQKKAIQQYLQELDALGEWSEREALQTTLKGCLSEIEEREAVIAKLDEDIWNQIRPLELSAGDAQNVKALLKRYRALDEEERGQLKNAQSLLDAAEFLIGLEKEEAPKEIQVRGTKKLQQKTPAVKTNTTKTTKTTKTSAASKPKSNEVKAKVLQGIVQKSEFEKVQGKDENLHIKGVYGGQMAYSFIFYGKDIKEAVDFQSQISSECDHLDEIRELSENPFVICMEHTERFPGEALLTIETNLEDGEYLLFSYDSGEMKAEYIKKVEVSKGTAAFTLDKSGDYFIAKRAKSASLKDRKAETENLPTADAPEKDWDENREIAVSGTAAPTNQYIIVMILGAATMLIGVCLGYMIGKNKNSLKEEKDNE